MNRCAVLDDGDLCGDIAAPWITVDRAPACHHHAALAIEAGRDVLGPTGNACALDDAGDIYERPQPHGDFT